MALIEPFPQLPLEIICLIIEQILEMEPKRAVELICLSRNIQPIIERALYSTIILHATGSIFADMIKSRLRPNTFYQSRTKVLCVAWIRDSDLMTIFPAISGVESLAIYPTYSVFRNNSVTFDVAELNTVTLTGPRPTKLSCHWRWMQPPPESPGVNFFPLPLLFDNVTHLELDIKPELFDGKRLHCMQHLTHLSLVDGTGSTPAAIWFSTLIQRLHLADSIAVCIIYSHFPFKGETGDYLSSPEPRIVLATSAEQDLHDERLDHVLRRRIADQAHFMRQWGKRLDSQEMDMWEEAEQIVRAQRAEAR